MPSVLHFKPYPEYKNSEVEWLGDIPAHWSAKRAKFCSIINMGQSPSSEDCNMDSIGLPFLQGNAEFGSFSPTPRQYCEAARKVARKGDLLISVRAPVGALNVADQDYGIGRGLCGITPDNSFITPSFCWYLLHHVRIQLNLYATGSTYDAVSADDVGNLTFLIPPEDEQRAIANFLDRETEHVDTLIAKKERQIELLQEKRAALVHEATQEAGTRNLRLGVVAGQVCRAIDREDEKIYVPIGLYNWGRGTFHKEPTPGAELGDSDFSWIKSGDLVLSGQFAWEGAVALAGEEEAGCVATHRYSVLRGKPEFLDTAYLFAFFTTRMGDFLLNEHSRGAAGRNRPLNAGTLLKEKIRVPPMKAQLRVSRHVYFERQFKKIVADSSRLLAEYRTVLISAAVTGKIDIREEVS